MCICLSLVYVLYHCIGTIEDVERANQSLYRGADITHVQSRAQASVSARVFRVYHVQLYRGQSAGKRYRYRDYD